MFSEYNSCTEKKSHFGDHLCVALKDSDKFIHTGIFPEGEHLLMYYTCADF